MIDSTALTKLGLYLKEERYRFTAVTPETHRRVLARPRGGRSESTLRELLGWSKWVERDKLPAVVCDWLSAAGMLVEEDPALDGHLGAASLVSSRVRVATLGEDLFFHSAYPTVDQDAVFFGPDSYRFVKFLKHRVISAPSVVVDMGCGSGVGGICLYRQFPHLSKIYLCDVNQMALDLASINARVNEVTVEIVRGDLLRGVPAGADLIVANPPFIIDSEKRAYRDGGGNHGTELSMKMVGAALEYLGKPGGRQLANSTSSAQGQLALYSGACVLDGQDVLLRGLRAGLDSSGCEWDYEQLDPDIFGEELSHPSYADVERIAAVGLTVRV